MTKDPSAGTILKLLTEAIQNDWEPKTPTTESQELFTAAEWCREISIDKITVSLWGWKLICLSLWICRTKDTNLWLFRLRPLSLCFQSLV